MSSPLRALAALLVGLVAALPCAAQNCAWSHVDHEVGYDASGIWNPTVYRGIVGALTLAQVGGALWEGSDTRLGKTMWQGTESQIVAAVGADLGKYAFTRARPSQEGDPCLWFQGRGHYSFPSGEAAVAAALVTPYVIEYAEEYPVAYGALPLPLYVGAGRIKNQQHWQTDVLAGWAVGGLSGWFAHSLETPLLIQILPHGFEVGLKVQF